MICFIAGQYMVYAHQHIITKGTVKIHLNNKTSATKTVSEKCAMCDAMHHTTIATFNHNYAEPQLAIGHVFKCWQYNFTSFQLILSGNRAPPAAFYLG
jgi:hypothetical protein